MSQNQCDRKATGCTVDALQQTRTERRRTIIITIKQNGGESPTAEMAVVPERFRMDPAKLRAIETKLLAKSRPDIEVRI